ncbi:hypothetical protein FRC01_003784 [Tulasnella sp. 417]|nr:hypothetical protein FRC01_003784 [Tulasnella sp. 417]
MTESVEHTLESTSVLKKLFERAFYGVTDTNSAIEPAQFIALEKIVPPLHDNANVFRQITCQPSGQLQSTTTSNYLLLYDHSDDTGLPSLSHEEVLRRLSQLFPTVQWHHGPKLTKKIDRDCVIDALRTYSSETDSNGRGGGLSGTGEEGDHTRPHEYHEPGRSGHGETNRMEEVAEGTGSLTEDGPPTANAEIQALRGSAAQQEAARIAIPVLSENYKNQKELLEKGKQFLQSVREVPLPTSGEGLTPQQLIDLIAARRERITVAIDLLEESDSLTQVRAKAVQSLKDQLVRTEKWAKDHGFDIQAHRESLKAKISSTGTGVNKKGKTGRTKRGSQAAADGNLRSTTADESNSGILATLERLKGLESKTEPKELEEQDKRLGRTEEGVEEAAFEVGPIRNNPAP